MIILKIHLLSAILIKLRALICSYFTNTNLNNQENNLFTVKYLVSSDTIQKLHICIKIRDNF